MARSKNWMSYPESFIDLVNTACIQPIKITCEDAKAAQSLRGYIYGFFSALEKEVKKPNGDEAARELRAKSCKIKLELNNEVLTALPRDMDSVAQAVASAIKSQTTNPISSDNLQPSAELAALASEAQENKPRE